MKIQLLDWQVEHLNYDLIDDEKRENNSFDLSTNHSFPKIAKGYFLLPSRLKFVIKSLI